MHRHGETARYAPYTRRAGALVYAIVDRGFAGGNARSAVALRSSDSSALLQMVPLGIYTFRSCRLPPSEMASTAGSDAAIEQLREVDSRGEHVDDTEQMPR